MANEKLVWDETGEKLFEAGIKETVLFPWVDASGETPGEYGSGVAWNGVSACNESPSGADETAIYADDTKYLSLRAKEEFGGTIEAYMYPDEWEECDGSRIIDVSAGSAIVGKLRLGQQARKTFALSYISTIGNDTQSYDYGEKIHFVYGATASPSSRDHATINDSPDVSPFSWEFTTIPLNDVAKLTLGSNAALKPIAHFTIASTDFPGGLTDERFKFIKSMVQGRNATTGDNAIGAIIPHMPYPNELYTVMSAVAGESSTLEDALYAALPSRFKPVAG